MKKTLVIVFLIFFYSTVCASAQIVKIANGDWEPFQSKKLKYHGVASRIVKESFASQKIEVEFVFVPWETGKKKAKFGKIDGTMIWTKTPERALDFYFSDPVCFGTTVFYHRKDFPFNWNTMNDLKGLVVGRSIGYNYGANFERAFNEKIFIVADVPEDRQNFEKLLKKRIHVFPLDIPIGQYMLQTKFTPAQMDQITYNKKPIRKIGYCLMLNKKNPANNSLMQMFNKGLEKLKTDGRFDQYHMESERGDYIIE